MAKIEAEAAGGAFLSKQSQYDRHPYLAIPPHPDARRSKFSIRDSCSSFITSSLAFLLFLCGLGVLFWPSNPEVKIIDIELNHVNISQTAIALDSPNISMDLKIQVRNRDFVSRDYNTILLLIQYEGKWQGNTTASGVSVDARSTASLELNAQFSLSQAATKQILPRNGRIPGESISVGIAIHIGGNFQFLYFNVLVNGSTSCAITIDTDHQTLTCQECCAKSQKPWRGSPVKKDRRAQTHRPLPFH